MENETYILWSWESTEGPSQKEQTILKIDVIIESLGHKSTEFISSEGISVCKKNKAQKINPLRWAPGVVVLILEKYSINECKNLVHKEISITVENLKTRAAVKNSQSLPII